MEKVADVLNGKFPQFNSVAPNCFVSDALFQMSCENVDYLIVLEDEKFVGVLTDNEIARKVLYDERPLKTVRVSEFMSRSLPVVTSDASLETCMQLMERFNTRHLAVYDRFDFKGVISLQDVMLQTLSRRKAVFEDETVRHGYPWTY